MYSTIRDSYFQRSFMEEDMNRTCIAHALNLSALKEDSGRPPPLSENPMYPGY